ncbi:MAG: rod shape-determining protein MreD [Candidatus Thioglobus sp.]|nr:MAG: rod shape-determining protein MreD [Candidatus Thioglobus sp.]KAA0445797.1 MAG: rod shape-determining protein MreD [Candidatus Thioglobus sp.]
MRTQKPYIFLIKLTLLALIIGALPLPDIISNISPFWMLLFFTYWLTYFSNKWLFFTTLILGILVDILHGDILGQNALALILSTFFILKVKQSLAVSNTTTQQIYIFGASCIYLFIMLLVHMLSTQSFYFNYYFLFAPLSSALLWPMVALLLSKGKNKVVYGKN